MRQPEAPAGGEKSLPPEPRRHRREAGFKTRPPEGSRFPPKKTSHFLSLSFSPTLLSLSLSPSLFLYLYPSPFAVSPTTIMDLTARCWFLLSCLGVTLAIDLDAIDPGYYVDPTATSEAIDYKDPCKAGEIFPPFSPLFFAVWFTFYVEVETCHECVCGARRDRPERPLSERWQCVDVVWGKLEGTLCAFVLHRVT